MHVYMCIQTQTHVRTDTAGTFLRDILCYLCLQSVTVFSEQHQLDVQVSINGGQLILKMQCGGGGRG